MPTPRRLGPPDAPDDRQRAVFERIAGSRGRVAGPFLPLLHSPELADRIQVVGGHIRYESSLDDRTRELAILVTARRWTAQFEWAAHAPLAIAAGVPADVVEAIRLDRPPPGLDPALAAVHAYVGELSHVGHVDDATYAAALDRLGPVALVELTALVGYYTLLAMTLNAHGIGPDDGSEPLPPARSAEP